MAYILLFLVVIPFCLLSGMYHRDIDFSQYPWTYRRDSFQIDSGIPGHRIVPNEGHKQRKCRQCQKNRRRTKSGWRVATRFRCETCNVPLCRDETSERDCFRQYHEDLFCVTGCPIVI